MYQECATEIKRKRIHSINYCSVLLVVHTQKRGQIDPLRSLENKIKTKFSY